MSTETLSRVILNWPSIVNLADALRSTIQIARTGAFVSKRYGKFAITREDLAQMLHNFENVTPKPPTELPIDFDHLSMDPKKPGDGMAAGWMKKLELREDGDELWAEVEWTDDGADRIRNKEYRFISPSFIKDHTHKDGTKIGTTLLAAAITNHPFLEGMNALALNADQLGDFALSDRQRDEPVHLAEVGQRVMIAPGFARTQDEVGGTFEVAEVVGDGDDAFVTIKDANGVPHRWFRASELLPASATPAQPVQPNLAPGQKKEQQEVTMHAKNTEDELVQLATTIAHERGISLRAPTIEAGRRRPDLADARREAIGVEPTDDVDTQSRPVINLHDGESFFALCQRVSAERQIHLSQAIRMVSAAHPDLAEAYGRGESL
jgi:hypothetical protein